MNISTLKVQRQRPRARTGHCVLHGDAGCTRPACHQHRHAPASTHCRNAYQPLPTTPERWLSAHGCSAQRDRHTCGNGQSAAAVARLQVLGRDASWRVLPDFCHRGLPHVRTGCAPPRARLRGTQLRASTLTCAHGFAARCFSYRRPSKGCT